MAHMGTGAGLGSLDSWRRPKRTCVWAALSRIRSLSKFWRMMACRVVLVLVGGAAAGSVFSWAVAGEGSWESPGAEAEAVGGIVRDREAGAGAGDGVAGPAFG